jgi:hypothetical protein
MSEAARAAEIAEGNTHISSSPIAFTTRPPCSTVELRMMSRQRPTQARAVASPSSS